MAEGGFERRDPAFAKVASWRVAFNCFVEIADEDNSAELEAQVPNQEEQGNTNGPPLGALVVHVNIGDCEIGAQLVGRSAERASDHHASNSNCRITKRTWDQKRHTRDVAREGVRTAQWCWVAT